MGGLNVYGEEALQTKTILMTSTTPTLGIEDDAESSYQSEEAVTIPNFQMRKENFREFK